MNYAAIKKTDIANGDGVRVSLWVSGCPIHCDGCFNQELWDYDYGKPFTDDTINEILEALEPDYISGLSILGGEPLAKENSRTVYDLVTRVRERFERSKTIWLYTGYEYHKGDDILIDNLVDVVVDGPFIQDEKDISLQFRGSRNQRIIKLK